MTLLITGGFDFIGSAVVLRLLSTTAESIVNIDKMTYAASPAPLGMHAREPQHIDIQADICDVECVLQALHAPT